MSFDTQRVLGQIERGELRCGPDAARALAARAMEAYGNAVWEPVPAASLRQPGQVPSALLSVDARRTVISHAEAAAALRAQPGVWLLVGQWQTWAGAWAAADRIRSADGAPMYGPAGAFEARTVPVSKGAKVEARYVGEPSQSADEAWAGALASIHTTSTTTGEPS